MPIPAGYTSGQIVQAVPTGINSALVLIKTQTIGTTVSSVTVSDAFSATYDAYKIVLSGGATSDAAISLTMTLGATTSAYYWARNGRTFADADNAGAAGNTSSWRVSGGTSGGLSLSMDIRNPFLTDETSFNSESVNISTTGAVFFTGGYLNNTTSYTAFTLAPSSGTMTGGTIRIYGYTNS